MELDDCAFPLLAGVEITDDPNVAFDGANVALLVGARPRSRGMERARPARGQRRHLQAAGPGDQRPRGADDVKILVVGNPANTNALIAMQQRARRAARALHRDDAPRPQPRDRPARGEGRRGRRRRQEHDDLGQPLRDAVPRHLPRRASAASPPPSSSTTRRGWRATSSRPCRSAARRSSTRAARPARRRPPTPRSTTCATGSSARPRATGSRWRCRRTAPTASPEGIISGFPCATEGRRVRDRPGPGDQRVLAGSHRCDGRGAREERDAVEQLGLV